MNRITWLLGGVSAVLAAVVVWLALELQSARADLAGSGESASREMPRLTAAVPQPPAGANRTPPGPGGLADIPLSRVPATAATTAPPQADFRNEYALADARKTIHAMNDPAERSRWVGDGKARNAAQLSRLRDRLKLDPEAFDKIVSLLAEDEQLQQESYARCVLDPSCDMTNVPAAPNHQEEIAALLGPERYAEFVKFRELLPEWAPVQQLRGRLPESNYLTDANAERLMSALSEEREHWFAEAQVRAPNDSAGFGNLNGMVNYFTIGSIEEQLASAGDYSQRLRARAATVLNAEQLRAFNSMQDQLLIDLAGYLRTRQAPPPS